jgi:DNA-directed RNA polymerase specialized sigma24 family protein
MKGSMTMNDIQRAQAFRQAKQEAVGFLSRVLWQLAEDRDMFAETMHCALFNLWRKVDQLQGHNNPRILYRIALSANADAWQRRQDNYGPTAPGECGKNRFRQLRIEIAKAVRKIIAELPVEQSQAVVMRYIERRPWDDIAEALGTNSRQAQHHVTEVVETIRRRVTTRRSSAA